ncbi:hypothetical protein Tco_0442315 [Tanacetum coccineum]
MNINLKCKFPSKCQSFAEAVMKWFGGNDATKKTQRNLLKQQYENFTASSSKVLDQTFDRLQKLISQLEIHGESISQEDMNQNSTNEAINTAHGITTASTQATAVNLTTIDNLSDAIICAFFGNMEISLKNTGRKLTVNGNETIRFDKSKVYDWSDQAKKVSDSEEEDVPQAKIQKKTVKPSFAKIEFVKSKEQVKSPRKTTVKQGNQNRLNTHSPRGNQRNWNNMMSQGLGSNFEMFNKACYVCGSFDHLQYDCNNHH